MRPPPVSIVKPPVLGVLLFYWFPVVGWMAVIWLLSSATSSEIESASSSLPSPAIRDPLAHAVEFGVLAALLYRLLSSYAGRRPLAVWAVAAALTLAYGAVDEVHQSFVPGRHASLADIGYDALGALAVLLLVKLSVQLRRRARSCR